MDDVTAGAEGVLQNKEEDRIQELAARPYQVYKNVDILKIFVTIRLNSLRNLSRGMEYYLKKNHPPKVQK